MQNSLKRPTLAFCIIISLFLHALSLFMLQRHSIWFTASIDAKSSHALQSWRKEQILKETFQSLSKKETTIKTRPQKIRQSNPFAYTFPDQKVEPNNLFSFEQPRHNGSMLITPMEFLPVIPPSGRTKLELNLAGFSVPKQPQAPQIRETTNQAPKHSELPMALAQLMPPDIETLRTPMIAYQSRALEAPKMMDQSVARRAMLTIPDPPLPTFPTLEELETGTYSDFFDVDLVCLPKQGENGYLFAITIIPRSDLQIPKLHQHYSFLIDRANCIQRDRLIASKNAVLKALNELAPDDTFNIIVFDSKVEKLFSGSRSPDDVSIAQAKAFLDKVSLGSFFSPTDLYKSLLLTLPEQIRDDELYTAVLMSDGENLSKKSALQSILQTWTWQNSGKVALFTIALNSDAQLANLDVASALNKGALYISPTKTGIKRKMLKLMKNIQTPLAKNIACRAIGKTTARSIGLYPSSQELPHLYQDQPFVIIGECESPDDFILFVQGRLKDRWMNIKKTISFVNAKKGSSSLKQEWAHHQAYRCYRHYVQDSDIAHLSEAREWLQPFDIHPAFQ
jgi:hypothetical protein